MSDEDTSDKFGCWDTPAVIYRLMEDEEVGGRKGEHRETVMNYIQDLLSACDTLGIDPMDKLRQLLPEYEWKHLRTINRQAAKALVVVSDYVWLTFPIVPEDEEDGSDDEIVELVTATLLGRKDGPFRLFFCADEKDGSPLDKFAESLGGDPTHW